MKYAIVAAIAAILGAAATAGATSLGLYQLGTGSSAHLIGTDVGCVVQSGGYGGVMVCSRSGSPAWVWIGQKEILITTGTNTSSLKVKGSFRWSGAGETATVPTVPSPAAPMTNAELTSEIKTQFAAKIATTAPALNLNTMSCQVNAGGETGTCFATVTDPVHDQKGQYSINVNFGASGGLTWIVATVNCQNLETGVVETCA